LLPLKGICMSFCIEEKLGKMLPQTNKQTNRPPWQIKVSGPKVVPFGKRFFGRI